MFGFGKLRFRCVDKTKLDDAAHVDDYKAGLSIGRVTFGKLGFYYRDLGKKYFVPYEYIERSFIRICECQPDDSPAYFYYRLILVHGDKEFANLIFNEEKQADDAFAKLKELCPAMKTGYIPPADGKRRYFC